MGSLCYRQGELNKEAISGRTDHTVLRETESEEIATLDLCERHNITEQTFYRWRNKFGVMDGSEARRLRELESQNDKLKCMMAEQFLVTDDLKK